MKRLLSALVSVVVLTSGAAQSADFSPWQRSMRITFSGYSRPETLGGFPVLVVLGTNVTGFSYNDFSSASGADLRFAASNGIDELNYEIERWDTNGQSIVWVQAPAIADSNSAIRAFWGSASAAQPDYTTNGLTWTNGFVAVYHLAQSSGTNALDSTTNRYHGALIGGASWTNGWRANGLRFNGTTGYVNLPSFGTRFSGNRATLLVWARNTLATQGGANQTGFLSLGSGSNTHYPWTDGTAYFNVWRGTRVDSITLSAAVVRTNWHQVSVVSDHGGSGRWQMAQNAIVVRDTTSEVIALQTPCRLGEQNGYYYDGTLDEVQIANVARSSNWVWAAMMSGFSNATFMSYGEVARGGTIENLPATNVTASAACLNARAGNTSVTARVYWGLSDGGTNAEAWSNTNEIPAPLPGVLVSTSVSLPAANAQYFYRYWVTNEAAAFWAPSTESFVSGLLTLEVTDTTATELSSDVGLAVVTRPAGATNGPLTVWYSTGGTASNGMDYTLTSNVTIQAGATSAVITVAATPDYVYPEPAETVDLTLLPWNGMAGTPNSGTVTIADGLPPVNTWTGAGPWESVANWSLGFLPSNGQSVVINGSVLMSNSTPNLAAFTVNAGRTNTVEGTNTAINATEVSVYGVVTHARNMDTNAADGWAPNARLWIVCSNLTVVAGGAIDTDGRGYRGSFATNTVTGNGYGPGRGTGTSYSRGGAGYGGVGGPGGSDSSYGGLAYGSAASPVDPGSGGGGAYSRPAGDGGGAVRVQASGTVTVQGTVTASGTAAGDNGGGGSGGSIWIDCARLAGDSAGLMRADGGAGVGGGGGGAGGRISVQYSPALQTTRPGVRFSAAGATGYLTAQNGTLSFPDAFYLSSVIADQLFMNLRLIIPGLTQWVLPDLTVSNCTWALEVPGLSLTVSNRLQLASSANLTLPAGASIQVGTLYLTNNSWLSVCAGLATFPGTNYNGLLDVTGDVVVAGNSWLSPVSDFTNGGSVLLRMASLTLQQGAGIYADGTGYGGGGTNGQKPTVGWGPGAGTLGPGGGTYYAGPGGSYGGSGGFCLAGFPDATYGSIQYPWQPGSGGAGGWGQRAGSGGGAVRIRCAGTVRVDGTITANGGTSAEHGGGGSGGGILIECDQIAGGTSGVIRANGGNPGAGNGGAGGGGGGRVAVLYNPGAQLSTPGITYSAANGRGDGAGQPGQPGTVYFPNAQFVAPNVAPIFRGGYLYFGGLTSWGANDLVVSNTVFTPGAPFALEITNNLLVTAGGNLTVPAGGSLGCVNATVTSLGSLSLGLGSTFNCTGLAVSGAATATVCNLNSGALTLSGNGILVVQAAPTNAAGGWGAQVNVDGDVTIPSGSWILPYSHPTNGASVVFRMTNLTIAAGGGINADGKGYQGGGRLRQTPTVGWGPGGSVYFTVSYAGGGGGYGGMGGDGEHMGAGRAYGAETPPLHAGSGGGGGWTYLAGNGGGLVALECPGIVTVHGTISASGANCVDHGGGGSGGGIQIACARLDGSATGVIRANGGNGGPSSPAGGGGGGRIAVLYDPAQQVANPGVKFSTASGANSAVRGYGLPAMGSVYFPNALFLSESVTNQLFSNVRFFASGFTNWAPDRLSLENASLAFGAEGFELGVTNAITIGTNSSLTLYPGQRLGGYDLILTNGGSLTTYADTHRWGTNYSTLVVLGNSMWLGANSWVYPLSNPTNGGDTFFRTMNLIVSATNSGFNADEKGFEGGGIPQVNWTPGWGPGYGRATSWYGGGGGHGGAGGSGSSGTGGPAYGSSNAPVEAGSGAGGGNTYRAGRGGGVVRVEARDWFVLNGQLLAGGRNAGNYGGGGSGGGIFLRVRAYAATNTAKLLAGGGAAGPNGGGGGSGGRIAVWYETLVQDLATYSVTGGVGVSGTAGAAGSLVKQQLLPLPAISTLPAQNIQASSAELVGQVMQSDSLSTGGTPAYVTAFWGPTDGGTNNWAYTNAFPDLYYPPQMLVTNVTLPIPGITYFFRFFASNTLGSVWAPETRTFVVAAVTVAAPDAQASEKGGNPGAFAILRPESATNAAVTINYTMGGVASNAVDYAVLTGSVVIAAGSTSAVVTLSPILDALMEPTEAATLTLAPGQYVIGTPDSATVSIEDAWALTLGPANASIGPGSWSDASRWSLGHVPAEGEVVTVTNSLVLTNTTAVLSSFTLGAGVTLSNVNWNTALVASNLVISGTLTHPLNTDTNEADGWTPNARVWVQCVDFTLNAGGQVFADGRGYRGGGVGGGVRATAGYGPGRGLTVGAGNWAGGGGGHGGNGGDATDGAGGREYDSTNAPVEPGSGGGGGYQAPAGAGGGAVLIDAGRVATIHGTVTANGVPLLTDYGGGGAGGAVLINCRRLDGSTNGLVSVTGGKGNSDGGGAAGGRIAVNYEPGQQTANPGVRFAATAGAAGGWGLYAGDPGTIYFPDTALLSPALKDQFLVGGRLVIPGFTRWALDSLQVSDCTATLGYGAFDLEVTNQFALVNGGLTLPAGSSVRCGTLYLTNGSALALTASATNWAGTNYGAVVSVAGDVTIAGNSWLTPVADPANGTVVLLSMANLTLGAGAGINADGKGYSGGGTGVQTRTNGSGPGGGTYVDWAGGGAGYGGRGGEGQNGYAGGTYGSLTWPAQPGSGGAGGYQKRAGYGGGCVRIEASGVVTVNGTISANGLTAGSYGGGGSGGGIAIVCDQLAGSSSGLISANGGGGANNGGGAGGGRIAVLYNPGSQSGNPGVRFSALAGVGYGFRPSEPGTLYLPNLLFLASETFANQLFMGCRLAAPGIGAWAPLNLALNNCQLMFADDGYTLSVPGTVRIENSGALVLWQGGALACGTLVVTNNSSLSAYCGPTNWAGTNFSAKVEVAGDMTVAGSSWVYPNSNPTNGGSVYFRMNNLLVGSGSGFNADGRGFSGGGTIGTVGTMGYGPGRGGWTDKRGGGGGYGGEGGDGADAAGAGGVTYGAAEAPYEPGSGGSGGHTWRSGSGGGAVWIDASGVVTLHGTLTANATSAGDYGGGGSGGGIYVRCAQLAGSASGLMSAVGGDGNGGANEGGGGGGGGRIAVIFDPLQQLANPGVRFAASPGLLKMFPGTMGTLYFPTLALVPAAPAPQVFANTRILSAALSAWRPASLAIVSNSLAFGLENSTLYVSNALTVGAGGILTVFPLQSLDAGTLWVTNGGVLRTYSSANLAGQDYSVLVNARGTMQVGAGSWVYPCSHGTNGGCALFNVASLYVTATNAGFNANGLGYRGAFSAWGQPGYGPGRGLGSVRGGGGGHAGAGGNGAEGAGGGTYGNSNAPVTPGSGAGGGYQSRSGSGGGVIRVVSRGTVSIDGQLTANGGSMLAGDYGGGGAGGAIWIQARRLLGGSSAVVSANGGNGMSADASRSGGGGGGYVTLQYIQSGETWTPSVSKGLSQDPARHGLDGIVTRIQMPVQGTVFFVR